MANTCWFEMLVKGNNTGIERFLKAMKHSDNECWMGRGAFVDDAECEGGVARISGSCKWSIESALIRYAKEFEEERKKGVISSTISEVKRFVTLYDACDELHLNMEVISFEPGCGFSEHFKYENGEITEEKNSLGYDDEWVAEFNLAEPA